MKLQKPDDEGQLKNWNINVKPVTKSEGQPNMKAAYQLKEDHHTRDHGDLCDQGK